MSATTAFDWDAAEVGDPATPLGFDLPCGAKGPNGSYCTRPLHKSGQHVAEGMNAVLEVWPQAPAPTVADERLDEARQTTADELLRAVTADPRLWDRLPRRVVAALAAQAEAAERVAS
jgi:hypothetical protein